MIYTIIYPDAYNDDINKIYEFYKNNKENVIRLSESGEQLDSALFYIKENPRVKLMGLSTKGNLIFKEGINEVQGDFHLATAADIVADPSAPDAYVRGIMENKEWIFVDGKFVEQHIEEVKSLIKKTSSRNLEEAKIRAFQSFLSKIR